MKRDRYPIELRLLGPVEARGGPAGERLMVVERQRKRLALLAHLALVPGPHRRQSLLALLWPEMDEAAGRRALRQALHYLRKSLGSELFESQGYEEVELARSRVWCDALALEEAYARDEPETVVDLYRGDLLTGFHVDGVSQEFETSIEQLRTSIREKAVRAMRKLAETQAGEGNEEAAGFLARRALELDPFDEVSARLLIALLDRAGDRAGAVELYEKFASHLDEELRVEPSAETQELLQRVRSRDQARPPRVGRALLGRDLPRAPTSFIGRDEPLAMAERILRDEETRLLTLTGPAGVGKTRLALALAERVQAAYPDGVVFVPLDSLDDSSRALTAVARAVGYTGRSDKSLDGIREQLSRRRALLVLDGLDRVLDAATRIGGLLPSLSRIDVIATCRTPLDLLVEHILPVPRLSLPDGGRWIGMQLPLGSEAVALFLDRALAADPSFRLDSSTVDPVGSIVRRLDGLPLAIELAAARLRHLPVDELAAGLERDLDLLRDRARDRPDRHHTLGAAISWTDDLLSEPERDLFHRLGVFAGEFGAEAARAVRSEGGTDTVPLHEILAALVDHGLLERPRRQGEELRYSMLRTTREHALGHLGAEARSDCCARLARFYGEWTELGFRHWCTEGEDDWAERLEREYINVEVALDWATRHDVDRAAQMAAAIHHFWWLRGLATEGRKRLESIVRAGAGMLSPRLEGRLRVAVGGLADLQGDGKEAVHWMRDGYEVFRRAEDLTWQGWALQCLSNSLVQQGDLTAAEEAAREALALGRTLENPLRIRVCLRTLAEIAIARDQLDRAEGFLEESLDYETGDREEDLWFLEHLAEIARRRRDFAEAQSLCDQIISRAEAQGRENDCAFAYRLRGDLLRERRGSDSEIYELYGRALGLYREIGNLRGLFQTLIALGEQLVVDGHADRASRILVGVSERMADIGLPDHDFVVRLDRALGAARKSAGEPAYRRESLRGRRSTLDQLVALAQEFVPTVEIPMVAR